MRNFLPFKWRRNAQQQELDSSSQKVSPYQQEACDKLLDFYRNNQDVFDQYFSIMRTPSERKEFIKEVYGLLHYTDATSSTINAGHGMTLYRGLIAENPQDIQDYTNGLIDGEVVFGKKAQLHGTGIYMTTNENIAMKYAMNGGEYGSIVRCESVDGIKMADSAQLTADREAVLQLMCSQNQDDRNILMYSNFLNDNGVFASIIGYDAINIPEKDYVLVLNRGSIAVDGIAYYREGQEISQDDLNFELQVEDIEITEDVEMADIIH